MNPSNNVPVISYTPLPIAKARKVDINAPLQWLKSGWQTFNELRVPALSFGVLFAAIGALITYAALNSGHMLFTFWSGFVLVAPILATASYHMAKAHEEGKPVSVLSCLRRLHQNAASSMLFILFLGLIMVAWIRLSTLTVAIYTGSFSIPVELSTSFFSVENLGLFATLGVVGAAFSLLIFALLAWSMPMIVRGEEKFVTAIVSSFQTVFSQPLPMLMWGGIVAGMTLLSMATLFVAFAVVFPWLGFATWAAYKDLFEKQ